MRTTGPVPADVERSTPAELIEAFETAQAFWVQLEVAREMVKVGNSRVIPPIERHLDSHDRLARCNAGFVLAGLGDERGLAAIIAELKDKSPRPVRRGGVATSTSGQTRQDRYYAAHLLGILGDKRAVPVLIEHLRDESINSKLAIVLGKIGDRRAIPPLRRMLAHENPDRRLWAAYGLAEIGDPSGVPAVAEFLRDPVWVQRRHAAAALGSLGDMRALPALIEATADESPDVVVEAVRSLGNLGDGSALPHLKKLLGDQRRSTSWQITTVGAAAQEAIRLILSKKHNITP